MGYGSLFQRSQTGFNLTNEMAETWKTTQRCHECLQNGNTNYYEAQRWGQADDGKPLYRIVCPECGDNEYTKWDGKSVGLGTAGLGGWGGA